MVTRRIRVIVINVENRKVVLVFGFTRMVSIKYTKEVSTNIDYDFFVVNTRVVIVE